MYWFCHTSTWIRHRYTRSPSWSPLLPSSPYHLSGSSQCTSPKHPVSCIEPGLVISFIYDIIHVSVPFSQIIPPSPTPTESKRLFYTSVSLFLSCIQGYPYHYSAIKKNTFESALMRWMKLEPIIQSEVRQKENHQYSILTHIYGI